MQRISRLVMWMALFGHCLSHSENPNSTAESRCGGKEKASAILDVANDFVNQAKNLYPICIDDSNCGQKEASFAFLDVATNLIIRVKNDFPNCSDIECPKHIEKPMDCLEVLRAGSNKSGVYDIWPRTRAMFNRSLTVYCDMDTDGGGWTVIQRRGKFLTPKDYFYKDWKSYKEGFGNIEQEFWIGNDNIYGITNQAKYTIRFDLEDSTGLTGYAHYDTFWIEDETASYALNIEGYSGNVGDAMSNNNQMKFSTKDRKNDLRKDGSCAEMRQGAWWYNGCTIANLNGLYQPGIDSDKGITWQEWTQKWVSLAGAEMKVRPQIS